MKRHRVAIPQPDGWTYEVDEPVIVTEATDALRALARIVRWICLAIIVAAVGLAIAVGWVFALIGGILAALVYPAGVIGGFAARQGQRTWDEMTG